MHFTKLRLSGFKSFVDPTELHIRPGLTAVIGPNGCGKSNLLEALRWVMGETSAKSMRGAGMEDVIFAGAKTRPPRNFAEVTLTIDNTERRAPENFNDADAIEITRRITRDMGSNYKHNGKEIRARDAQTMFADAATGANSPALVRQGQISELINAKPKARRRILEDAAGIAGLHARRHEALLRLSSTEQNLERILEVLGQLQSREAALQKEAERASKYRQYATELRLTEGMLIYRRWREASKDLTGAKSAIDAAVAAAAEAAKKASEAGRERTELEDGLPKLREEDAIARALHQKLLMTREGLEAKQRDAEATAQRLQAQIHQLEQDRTREEALGSDAGQMIERLQAEIQALEALGDDDRSEEIEAARAHEATAEEAVRSAEATLDRLNADAARVAAERQGATRRAEEAERAIARIATETAEARRRREALTEERRTAEASLEYSQTTAEEARAALAEAEERLLLAEEARTDAQTREAEARTSFTEAQGAQRAFASEAEQLKKLLVAEKEDGGEPIFDQLRVAAGAEMALGAALADELRKSIDETGFGWRTLPKLYSLSPLPDRAQPMSELVDGPPALNRRLAQTGLIPREEGFELQQKLKPGQRLVSPEGDMWRWDGFSQSADQAPNTASLALELKNRLEELEKQLGDASAKLHETEQAFNQAAESLQKAQDHEVASREARRAAEREAGEAERIAAKADTAVSGLASRLDAVAQLLGNRDTDAADAQSMLEDARAALAAFDGAETTEMSVDEARARAETARGAFIEARGAREDLERQSRQRGERLGQLGVDRDGWIKRRDASAEQRTTIEARLGEASEALEEARLAPETISEERERISEEADGAEKRLADAVDELSKVEGLLREAARAEKEAGEQLAEAKTEQARLEARSEAATERAEDFAHAMRDFAGCDPEEFPSQQSLDAEALPTVKDLERAISILRQNRDKLGAVNLRADQELQEVAAERESIETEQQDLDAAVEKLRQGVNELNKEGRQRLLAAFEEVNRNFSALFDHLFGQGGTASLVLVESDDPLDAGLEIMCQPPGKRLSNLSLLSGGEQTLTAISLIFAVFMVNPAPICVLDEVDAPLDDANVTRFCELLDEMTRRTRTRFLIITHHAITMSRMDRLFGVTMVERGVSQLVSVDLQTAVEMVDA
ncbi:MAG: AAA family ATPase [Pseudomonadota bacterium]